jgi:YD repeat-containing protein
MRLAFLTAVILAALAAPAAAAEICGNALDDNSNSMADEGCHALVTGVCESPLGCGTNGAVAPKSGAITYALPPDFDIETPRGPSLTFRRTYQSLYEPGGGAPAYRTPLGPHWTHSYASWVDKVSGDAIVHTTDGRDVWFDFDQTSGGYDYYVPQEGFHVDYLRQSTSTPYHWQLRTLTGVVYTYDWSSPTGKLIGISDSLATPNTLAIQYDGAGQVSTVKDASGTKQLLFSYTSGDITSIAYQTISGGTPTTRETLSFSYTSGNATTVSNGGGTLHTMGYRTGGYVEYIRDAATNDIVYLTYLDGTPGKVVRSVSEAGEVGYEYASARASCSGGTVVYLHRTGTTACDDDSDCGSDYLCGGETNLSGTNTGVCYKAARCLTLTSPDEDLIDTVSPLPATTCTGACLENTEYDWGSAPELAGVEAADGTWTSYQRNGDGLVTLMAQGDTDSDPTNAGGLKTWYFYGDSSFPGRVTEVRRMSELKADGGSPACDASTTTDCARTINTWNSDGLLASRQDLGFTIDATGATVSYSYTTSFTYDSAGRVTQIDGPLSGSNDVTDFTYWSSSDVLKDGYRKEIKRKKDTSNYLVTTLDGYDYWGRATSRQDPDSTFTCLTYDTRRGYLKEERVAMAGQTSCGTTNGADLVTSYTRDSWLRLTKVQKPLGNCEHREYGAKGRLSKIKERDDCNAASSGDTIEYTYSDDGQVIKVEYKNASGTVTKRQESTYLDGRQLGTEINPVSTSYSRSYGYTADGLLSQIDFENTLGKTVWLWDAFDRQDEVRRYKTGSTFDTWDSSFVHLFGKPRTVEDDDAKAMQRFYDDLGREVKIVSPDSGTTLLVYDAAGRLVTKVEADGATGEVSHAFTYDNLGRLLTADYGTENCGTGQPVDIAYTYDAVPSSCPGGATCTRLGGRLAHVRSTLLCSASYGDNTLDQEVFYGYDDAGRIIKEYIQDDSGRTAGQSYSWDKNGNSTEVTTPSNANTMWTYGGMNNADTDKVVEMWRGGTGVVTEQGKWLPFGPIDEYRQKNTTSGWGGTSSREVIADLTWNLAYRATQVFYKTNGGTNLFRISHTEDAKGRTTVRDYEWGASGLQDSYLQYDWLDRLLCDAAVSGTCPTSGSNLKSNVNGSPPYSASNDRTQLLHRHPSYGTYTYTPTLVSGKDRIDYFTTSPSTGTTTFGWDDRGNRTSDDSSAYSNDARAYTYDGRSNVRQITGQRWNGSAWANWTITNAYDHKGRRVFKDYTEGSTTAQWFFYYDLEDRLIEAKHTPNISSPSTYSMYQWHWIGSRPVAYWQTDYPSVSTTRRYLHSDENNRVLEAWHWPNGGGATSRVWAINPNANFWDEVVLGSNVFQPLRGTRQDFYDSETVAWANTGTPHRPPLHAVDSGGGFYYDPLTATRLEPGRSCDAVDSYVSGCAAERGRCAGMVFTTQPSPPAFDSGAQAGALMALEVERGGALLPPIGSSFKALMQTGGGSGSGGTSCSECNTEEDIRQLCGTLHCAGPGPIAQNGCPGNQKYDECVSDARKEATRCRRNCKRRGSTGIVTW